MPFSLVQGEDLRRELRIEYRGDGLFFTPSTTVRLTNRRVVSTESFKRGNDVTKCIPLEEIIYMHEGRSSSLRWLIASAALALLGIIAMLTVVGIIVGVILIVVALIALVIFLFKGSQQSLIIESGGSDSMTFQIGRGVSQIRDIAGGESGRVSTMDEFIRELEQARQECAFH